MELILITIICALGFLNIKQYEEREKRNQQWHDKMIKKIIEEIEKRK